MTRTSSKRYRIPRIAALAAAVAASVLGFWTAFGSFWFEMPPGALLHETARTFATPFLAVWHASDAAAARELQGRCFVGPPNLVRRDPSESWALLSTETPGFDVLASEQDPVADVPFVYELPAAPHLVELRQRYDLEGIVADATDEYDAMVRFGSWMGTRWEHGYDVRLVPGGRLRFRVADVIAAGEKGARFWCEIDAKATVQAASALGWPARLVSVCRDVTDTKSRHAVAELWSNQHDKWFVLDTDFNVVFEVNGVPLSAWELTHQGPSLLLSGQLRARRFAPDTRALDLEQLVSFYRFTYIDLRNDWVSRRLPRGSPAGGDLATWWTARPGSRPVLTAKRRIEAPERFDWKVNTTQLHLTGLSPQGASWRLDVAPTGYAPYYDSFWIQVDHGEWRPLDSPTETLLLDSGTHELRARIQTSSGGRGAITRVTIRLPSVEA